MCVGILPASAQHHKKRDDQAGLREVGEDGFGEIEIEKFRLREQSTPRFPCVTNIARGEVAHGFFEGRGDGEILEKHQAEFCRLRNHGVEREDQADGSKESPASVLDDRTCE